MSRRLPKRNQRGNGGSAGKLKRLAYWLASVDCDGCLSAYGDKLLCPCEMCRPTVHRYNLPIFTVFRLCKNQLIMGPDGPVAILNDSIINTANKIFDIRENDLIDLVDGVHSLFSEIKKISMDK